MRLVDLHPTWLNNGGDGVTDSKGNPVPERHGVGVDLDCPCGCEHRLYVPFENPLDGGPALPGIGWKRAGDTFETLTLTPSIQRKLPCSSWHGFITNGEVRKA